METVREQRARRTEHWLSLKPVFCSDEYRVVIDHEGIPVYTRWIDAYGQRRIVGSPERNHNLVRILPTEAGDWRRLAQGLTQELIDTQQRLEAAQQTLSSVDTTAQ